MSDIENQPADTGENALVSDLVRVLPRDGESDLGGGLPGDGEYSGPGAGPSGSANPDPNCGQDDEPNHREQQNPSTLP